MNYLEIVFNGYLIENNRKYLIDYFEREFKKAEKENYSIDEFINGCISVIEDLEKEMDKRLFKRKSDLYLLQELNEIKTKDDITKEKLKHFELELSSINRNNFPVNLLHFTKNKYVGNIFYTDVLCIRDIILQVEQKCKKDIFKVWFEDYYDAGRFETIYKNLEKSNLAKSNLKSAIDFEFGNWYKKSEPFTNEIFNKFYHYLKDKELENIKDRENKKQKKIKEIEHSEIKPNGLRIDQIALIHFYEANQITRDNGNEIARNYNHTSGEKLFQRFTYYSSTANRKGKPTPCTPKKLKNKIELFESVVIHLSDKVKQRALDEIIILKTILEKEYS